MSIKMFPDGMLGTSQVARSFLATTSSPVTLTPEHIHYGVVSAPVDGCWYVFLEMKSAVRASAVRKMLGGCVLSVEPVADRGLAYAYIHGLSPPTSTEGEWCKTHGQRNTSCAKTKALPVEKPKTRTVWFKGNEERALEWLKKRNEPDIVFVHPEQQRGNTVFAGYNGQKTLVVVLNSVSTQTHEDVFKLIVSMSGSIPLALWSTQYKKVSYVSDTLYIISTYGPAHVELWRKQPTVALINNIDEYCIDGENVSVRAEQPTWPVMMKLPSACSVTLTPQAKITLDKWSSIVDAISIDTSDYKARPYYVCPDCMYAVHEKKEDTNEYTCSFCHMYDRNKPYLNESRMETFVKLMDQIDPYYKRMRRFT